MPGASIYILRCADGSFYTGITRRSVEERVSEHAQGLDKDSYTFTRRPVKLVHSETYDRVDEAIASERRIKGWFRAKKEAYMRGDYDRLSALARRARGLKRFGGAVPAWPTSFEAASRRLRTRSLVRQAVKRRDRRRSGVGDYAHSRQ